MERDATAANIQAVTELLKEHGFKVIVHEGDVHTVIDALGDKTTEVIEDYIGRFRINIFRYRIEPELAQIIVDNMGDDEAQQVLSEILPLRDNSNRTFLHYSQYLETIKIYAKALKDKAPETFAKAYPAEIIDKISYGYHARKLIHAIIAGEKV